MNKFGNIPIQLFAIAVMLITGAFIGVLVGLFSKVVYLIIVFPVGMGFLGTLVVSKVLTFGKVRNFFMGMIVAVLLAVTLYGALHFTQYMMFRSDVKNLMEDAMIEEGMEASPEVANLLVDYALKDETGYTGFVGYILYQAKQGVSIGRISGSSELNIGTFLSWVYWFVELGIIIYICVGVVKETINQPFCENCNQWYGKEKRLGGKPEAEGAILPRLLEMRDFSGLGRELRKDTPIPSLEVYVQDCATCTNSATLLSIQRISYGQKGNLKYEKIKKMFVSASDKARIQQGMIESQ